MYIYVYNNVSSNVYTNVHNNIMYVEAYRVTCDLADLQYLYII